ncbi:MAG: tRNA (N(6)-L-threonylcarbamoyladenosine(37)-C(2))-methylthiotransferase MtaB [Firmicutes bacterium]|nr:tRNA (N(6)-L-threonylcarbamoyladenosine(37)-C(2))-methylthiotransferase MtaB [Bacillota bacterium]
MNKGKTVAFSTLGCKVNQYDTDAVLTQFLERGYRQVEFGAKADVYVINTCTVTNAADRKSRQMIRRAQKRNPNAKIVVMGCLSQIAPGETAAIAGVNLIVGTDQRGRVAEQVEALRNGAQISLVDDIFKVRDFEDLPALDFSGRTRATLKIQDGCDQFCTYCRVPFARGYSRSRPFQSIVEQARELVAAGFSEIVLTGINLGLFGKDLIPVSNLEEISRSLADLPGLARLRISSVDPHEITAGLLNLIAGHSTVCRHLHIPLQSGSDRILKSMKRNYSRQDFLDIVHQFRSLIPQGAITTDVMVGFPGETERDFAETVELVKAAGFSRVHVFRYSRRRGTAAARFKEQVPAAEKENRSSCLIEVSKDLAYKFHLSFLDRTVQVLVEEADRDFAVGLTDHYIRVKFPVEKGLDLLGKTVPVKITEVDSGGALGRAVK